MPIGSHGDLGRVRAPHICETGAEAVDIRMAAAHQERNTVQSNPNLRPEDSSPILTMRELVRALEAYALLCVMVAVLWDELRHLIAQVSPRR